MTTILVVDDEIGIRELLSEILRDEGYTVDTAENAQQAQAYRQRCIPDLVLLDVWMPDADGLTLLKTWAQRGELTMPVIMMSGHASIDTAVEATQIGAFDFLEKPIALKKLLQSIDKALAHACTHAAPPPLGVLLSPGVSLTPLNRVSATLNADAPPIKTPFHAFNLDLPLRAARDAFERIYFEHHLAQENGNMTRIAEKTGLERTHLYRKLKQLGLNAFKAKTL